MSGRRHHLLPLTATGLALALGLGLGAGPVAEDDARHQEERAARLLDRIERLDATRAAVRAKAADDAEVLAALSEPLTRRRLAGQTVLVVATPSASPVLVRRVTAAVEDASAELTGSLRLRPAYVDPARAESPLEDLALRLVPPGVEFADDATPIERVGTVLARATVQRPEEGARRVTTVDRDAAEVIAGLDELDAVRLHGRPGRRADLAVIVAGRDREPVQAAVTGLLAALDTGSNGAVLVAPGRARAGPLRWVRDSDTASRGGSSTVDGASATGGPARLAAVVLALVEQLDGGSGDYGLGRAAARVLPDVPRDG